MKSAYKTSGAIFDQVSKLHQPGLREELDSLGGEIVVIKGDHDRVEELLDTIKVPYALIESNELATYNGGRVFFVNCRRYGGISASMKDAVKERVSSGGRLITSDWSLSLTERVFPGKLHKTTSTTDDVMEVQCETDIARKLIGLNYAQCSPQWWLEGSSDVYSIGKNVTPLLTSREMEARYGQPYVAVGFTQGRGEALHFISHFVLQRTKQKGKEKSAGLDDFLAKIKIERTAEMDDATLAELEAAYSSLNTVAYLCLRAPLLPTDMKSMLASASQIAGKKSARLI